MRKTLTKIICLGVGLAVGLVLIAKVYLEVSYDSFIPDADQVFQINETGAYSDQEAKTYGQTPGGVAPGLKEFTPLVEVATRYTGLTDETNVVTTDDKKVKVKHVALADDCFFDVLGRPIILGNAKEVLGRRNYCMIPRSLAEKLGGDAVDMKLKIEGLGGHEIIVGGVYEDFPINSIFYRLGILISMETYDDFFSFKGGTENFVGNDRYKSYIRVVKGTKPEDLTPAFEKLVETHCDPEGMKAAGVTLTYEAQPLTEVHTDDENVQQTIWIYLLIAGLLLICAVMNYLLIVIGQMVTRSKEMAIRKCYGAETDDIHLLVFKEALLHWLLSLALAAGIVFLCDDMIKTIFGVTAKDLFFQQGVWVLAAVALAVLFVTGVVPGWLYNSIPVSSAFRNYKEQRRLWKRSLLALQFVVTGFLICLQAQVALQYNMMVNDNVGYNPENLAYIETKGILRHAELMTLIGELRKLSGVQDVQTASSLPFDGLSGNSVHLPGKEENFHIRDMYWANPGWFDLMEIPIVQGTTFQAEVGDTTNLEIMVDERFVEKAKDWFGWEKDNVVGQSIMVSEHDTEKPFTIVGIYGTIRTATLSAAWGTSEPTIQFTAGSSAASVIYIRCHNLDNDFISKVEELTQRLFPTKELTVRNYKVQLVSQYDGAKNFRHSVMLAGIVTLIITLIGLIGYISDEVSRRSKEIAIRKVNGATTADIYKLFFTDAVVMALPALLIGAGAAAYVGNEWQQRFLEHVPISPLMLGLCVLGLIVLNLAIVAINTYKISNSNPVNYLKNE